MNYSRMIYELRNKMLLTQQEFADFLGVSFVSVNRWENKVFNPTMKTKRKLASYFKKYDIKENNRKKNNHL